MARKEDAEVALEMLAEVAGAGEVPPRPDDISQCIQAIQAIQAIQNDAMNATKAISSVTGRDPRLPGDHHFYWGGAESEHEDRWPAN